MVNNDDLHESISKIDVQGLVDTVRNQLAEAGLDHIDVKSIQFYMKADAPDCPVGTSPVVEVKKLRDGTVITRWVCK